MTTTADMIARQQPLDSGFGYRSTADDVLAGYDLAEDDKIDAIRALRASIHGFVMLEATGGFGMPRETDRSFDAMILALTRGFAR